MTPEIIHFFELATFFLRLIQICLILYGFIFIFEVIIFVINKIKGIIDYREQTKESRKKEKEEIKRYYKTYPILSIANEFIKLSKEENRNDDIFKLEELCIIANGYHLFWKDRPIFNEKVEVGDEITKIPQDLTLNIFEIKDKDIIPEDDYRITMIKSVWNRYKDQNTEIMTTSIRLVVDDEEYAETPAEYAAYKNLKYVPNFKMKEYWGNVIQKNR